MRIPPRFVKSGFFALFRGFWVNLGKICLVGMSLYLWVRSLFIGQGTGTDRFEAVDADFMGELRSPRLLPMPVPYRESPPRR